MKKLLVCAAAAALLGMHSPSQAGEKLANTSRGSQKAHLKIMPLGDSITWGARDPSYGGYRRLLGKLLTDDGYSIRFVGSLHSGKDVIPDSDNEGHPGWRIPQVKDGIDANGWLETYKPDIILLHIGTNDIHEGDAAAAPGNLSALLDDILARLPHTHIIVAQIIPFRRGPDRDHESYNAAIPGIAAAKGPRVSVVDMQNILTRDDYVDGLHPNASGYDKMARAWEGAIRAIVAGSSGQPPTSAPPQSARQESEIPAQRSPSPTSDACR